jgi:hypothetical protein
METHWTVQETGSEEHPSCPTVQNSLVVFNEQYEVIDLYAVGTGEEKCEPFKDWITL